MTDTSGVVEPGRRTILVPVDESRESAQALPIAQGLAGIAEATVHILHVSADVAPVQSIREHLRLSEPAAPATGQEPSQWHRHIIVMCTHGGGQSPSRRLAKHAEDILLHTPCPVVFVPPAGVPSPWSIRRVLVPHDGTPTSALAIAPVGYLCRRTQAEMTLLHVSTAAADPAADHGALTTPRYIDQPQHEWPAWGTEFLDRIRAVAKPPCNFRLRTVLGTEGIGQAIVRFAAEDHSDIIILAWRGKLGPDRAHILRLVVERAPCPVAVYRVTADKPTSE